MRLNSISKHLHHRGKAQALVEFALVFPLLLLLIGAGSVLGRAYFVGIEMSNAAREASLYVARNAPYTSGTGTAGTYSYVLPNPDPYTSCPSTTGGAEGGAVDAGCASFAGSALTCPASNISWQITPTSMPQQTGNSVSDSFEVKVTTTCMLPTYLPFMPPTEKIVGTSTSWVQQP